MLGCVALITTDPKFSVDRQTAWRMSRSQRRYGGSSACSFAEWSASLIRYINLEELDNYERIRRIVEEVNTLAGSPIVFMEYLEYPKDSIGAQASCSTDTGRPEVHFYPGSLSLINACHEVLHLKCEYLKYPRTRVTFDLTADLPIEQWAVYDGITEIVSLVEHRVIYPQMEALGFDPWKDVEQRMQHDDFFGGLQKMRDLAADGGINASGHMNLMARSARLLLELRNAELRSRFLRDKNWFAQDFRTARKIVDVLKRAGLTQNACRRAMVRALDLAEIPRDSYNITMGPANTQVA
jgi:hypothetical protein